MPVLDKADKQAVESYNDFVRNSEYGGATQDINWSLVKTDWENEQVYIEKDGRIIAAMSLIIKRAGICSMIYAPRGPVCDLYDIDTVNGLVAEVGVLAKKYNAFLLRFDPKVRYDEDLHALYEKFYIVRNRDYDRKDFIQSRYHLVLSIKDCREETLLKNFSRTAGYNIRLAQKKGVTVRFSRTPEDLKIFYDIYTVTAKRNRFGTRSIAYFKRVLEAYEQSRIYIAEQDGDPLSAALLLRYGKRLWYFYSGSGNIKRQLKAAYLMQWEMMKWGLETGACEYDLGGVLRLDRSDGLYNFKEAFCRRDGVTEYIGEIDKVYKPFLYFLFIHAAPALKKILRRLRSLLKRGKE